MDNEFDRIAGERKTASAKACIEIARSIYSSAAEDASAEARQWVRLGIEADRDEGLRKQLADLQEKFGKKGKARDTANGLKARKKAVGGNVVAFPGKDAI